MKYWNDTIFLLFMCRKRPVDDQVSDFDSAISSTIQILLKISGDFLTRSSSNIAGIDENEMEFMDVFCESMVSLATSNMQCILRESTTLSLYIQQVISKQSFMIIHTFIIKLSVSFRVNQRFISILALVSTIFS